MVMQADALDGIRRILIDDMKLRVTREDLPDNASLLERGLALDSIVIAELMALVEDRFSIRVDDWMLRAELFDDIALLAAFVVERCAKAGANAR